MDSNRQVSREGKGGVESLESTGESRESDGLLLTRRRYSMMEKDNHDVKLINDLGSENRSMRVTKVLIDNLNTSIIYPFWKHRYFTINLHLR